LELDGTEGNPAISLKTTEFSLKQFVKLMGQANYSAFNKWKKGWVAGFLGKKHQSIVQGLNHLKHVRNGPLHWEMAVSDLLEIFQNWLALDNFDNAGWIHQQWVEMCLKKCASKIQEARK
jgi:hypothetical protein